ncbi:MAG: GNAT family N-acetyltransferase [Ferruginibacter sp.]
MDKKWLLQSFNELSSLELYKILEARNAVFVVEQYCNYLDTDGKDLKSYHLTCIINNEVAAYCRILPPGISYTETSIGRVLTTPKYRGQGLGIELMKLSILHAFEKFPGHNIRLGAQLYLKQFYNDLGFTEEGEEFLEDNIPHIEMTLQAISK